MWGSICSIREQAWIIRALVLSSFGTSHNSIPSFFYQSFISILWQLLIGSLGFSAVIYHQKEHNAAWFLEDYLNVVKSQTIHSSFSYMLHSLTWFITLSVSQVLIHALTTCHNLLTNPLNLGFTTLRNRLQHLLKELFLTGISWLSAVVFITLQINRLLDCG